MSDPSPWWAPHIHTDRRPFLLARRHIGTRLRRFFEERDFVEVEARILQVSPGNEAHLHAFGTTIVDPSGARAQLYLHTSPEFDCKKLLAAGESRIFEFARVFRNRERGALHHPEFTLLEWYRANEPYEALMADCEAVLAQTAEAAETKAFSFRGRAADPFVPAERLTVAAAFSQFANIDLLATISRDDVDRDCFAAELRKAGVRTAPDDSWSDMFSRVLVEKVEPYLGLDRPTILYEYPAVEAALAQRTPADARVAERFELYLCGVELANGFGELTDPLEQRGRFELEMSEKERIHGERYPIDEDFLAALAHTPPASGCALGFDRLVMLASGAARIEQVLWAPVPEPGTW
jgi:elongation factor P--(R)-beta-lysine ligase